MAKLGIFLKKIFVFRRFFENNNDRDFHPEYSFSKIFSPEIINEFFFWRFSF